MTFGLLKQILEKNHISENATLMSDSGWECDSTNMNGVFYNQETNCVVFTQGGADYKNEYAEKPWQALYIDEEE